MKRHLLEGIVKRHPDGFGFVITDDDSHPDIYVPRHFMSGIMTNDRVQVQIDRQSSKQRTDNRYSGQIMNVVHRATTHLMGRFHASNPRFGLIIDEGHGWGENMKIPAGFEKGAQDGDWVRAQVVSYPGSSEGFIGRVVDIIGDIKDPLNDIKRVLFSSGLRVDFSPESVQEAKRLPAEVGPSDTRGRIDSTHLPFVTIDGATAKDFDDAICTETTSFGFRTWVAIADVSHYVPFKSALDIEARLRGNSTYFPNFVVPMLPEALSNELCSLKPRVPRLALVAEIHLDFQGQVKKADFFETVIRSRARLTYGQAQEIVEGNMDLPEGREPGSEKAIIENVLRSADLAKLLMAKRFREGSLDLEIPETSIILDETGEPQDIARSERLFAHRLIEELMLLANVEVAKFIDRKKVPGLYRVHEPPADENVARLERFLSVFGNRTPLHGGQLQKKLTRVLEKIQGTHEGQVLSMLTLRTMNQAQYSAENVGHFGLAFDFYAHFTSPIRRYADLVIHRIIKSLILPRGQYQSYEADDLASLGTHLSACEQRSVKAERNHQAIKKARFIQRHLGDVFEGFISGVAKFGVFVQLRAFDVDGLVRVDTLGDDRWDFDEENLLLRGRKTGRLFKVGDTLEIQVASADTEAGQITFVLNEEKVRSSQQPRHKERGKPAKKRHGSKPQGRAGAFHKTKKNRKRR